MPNMCCFYPFLSFTCIVFVKKSGKQEGKDRRSRAKDLRKENGCRGRNYSIKQRAESLFRIRKKMRQEVRKKIKSD